MAQQASGMSVVVMAKLPAAGRVKTRLQPAMSPQQASQVHEAMLRCVMTRVAQAFAATEADLVLAVDVEQHAEAADAWADAMGGPPAKDWRCVGQGVGDLGQRLGFVASGLQGDAKPDHAVAFLGVDSPDAPFDEFAALLPALPLNTAAVGRVADGGYWALAARPWRAALVAGIDWGASTVYDQTLAAIQRAHMRRVALPDWFDVDEPADLTALRQRIATSGDPALQQLSQTLNQICKE